MLTIPTTDMTGRPLDHAAVLDHYDNLIHLGHLVAIECTAHAFTVAEELVEDLTHERYLEQGI